jgi:Tol biopolymer transport system component
MKRIALSGLVLLIAAGRTAFGQVGIFSNDQNVGAVAKPGAATFDADKGQYLITGGGANMWTTNDEFHFVWTKVSGDFSLAADIKFPTPGGNPHRKACLMVRQSLDPGSAYVDLAAHGIGLTALQCRDTDGDLTHEVILNVSAPERVRIEKHGDFVTASFSATNEPLQVSGASYKLPFKEPFYVGLAVCAHDNKTTEQGQFSNVELQTNISSSSPAIECTLETMQVSGTDRSIVYHTAKHIEAPNWSRDGKYFIFNSGGRIYKLAVTNGTPEVLDTGSETNCNNDHGISPDGAQLAISDGSQGNRQSRVYVLPIGGGQPRQITAVGPSYWHGWSPDGTTLAFCGERNTNFDVYSVPVNGGKETRLTTAPELDDGPDYSPDGKYIYFNSERTGLMQIWRMNPDGSNQEQVTSDDYNNWFAHPSPNGQWIVFLTYDKAVKGHPANQDVMLRLMSLSDKKIRVLAKLYGGQGTMNVPSWSPDSRNIAFVSYQRIYH